MFFVLLPWISLYLLYHKNAMASHSIINPLNSTQIYHQVLMTLRYTLIISSKKMQMQVFFFFFHFFTMLMTLCCTYKHEKCLVLLFQRVYCERVKFPCLHTDLVQTVISHKVFNVFSKCKALAEAK